MATIIMAAQLLLAVVMVVLLTSNPVAVGALFKVEEALSFASKVVAVLDGVVSLLLIGERDSAEGKLKAARDMIFDFAGLGISIKVDNFLHGLGEGYELTKIFYQTVSGIQQCFYNMTEAFI